jgi:hypothetical protein
VTTTPDVSRIESCPALDLDMAELGEAFFRLALTARQLGHKDVASTVRDYYHPQTPTMEFVKDVMTEDPQVVAERWFGGDSNALQITNALMNAHRRERG